MFTVNPNKHAITKLRVKGHKLSTHWSGAGDGYARGGCECGWTFKGWSERMVSVRVSHQGHLRSVLCEAVRIPTAEGEARLQARIANDIAAKKFNKPNHGD